MYMSSPVVIGDLMFCLSHLKHGQFFCLDPGNGRILWTSEGRQAENAAIVCADSAVFFLTNDAELIVVRNTGKGFEPLRKYSVADSPTWAHPVVWNSGVLIKDATTLALWAFDRSVIFQSTEVRFGSEPACGSPFVAQASRASFVLRPLFPSCVVVSCGCEDHA
jgi:hypothetical protein